MARTAAIALIFLVNVIFPLSGLAAGILAEEIQIPAEYTGTFGKQTVLLHALVVRPDDNARHPLVVVSHGAPRDASARAKMSPRDGQGVLEEFARQGFAACMVMRRGYGASQGAYAEYTGECASPRYVASGTAGAEDIREAIRLMREKPYVDPGTVIAVGLSAGGFSTVALTAAPTPGLKAAISFAGGRGSQSPDTVCDEPGLVRAFGTFGKTSRVPMLWVYSENDHYFRPELAKRFHQAFAAAGGRAELVMAPPFGEDGHRLFSRVGIPQWTPYVDAFLAKLGLKPAPGPAAGAISP